MPETYDHGGGCCGITHCFNFGPTPDERRLRSLDDILANWRQRKYYNLEEQHLKSFNAALECVLTDNQLANGWARELKLRGFKVVHRFLNSNSGNYCNVLYYTPHEPRGRNRRPPAYTW